MMRPLLLSFLLLFLLMASHASAHTPAPTQPPVRKGKDLAVFIANNAYTNWEKLNYPIREAEAIAGELAQNFDFDTLVLRNKSREAILDEIARLSNREYAPDAQLLLFFSGHGYYNAQRCLGYFIPQDGKKPENDISGASFIDYRTIREDINLLPCRHIMVALDACFAGTFDAAMTCNKSKGDTDDERPVTKRDERQLLIDDLLKGESRILFSAAGKEPKSDRSDFARRFLDALQKGCNKEGHLTADDLRRNWLQYAVPKPRLTQFGADTEGKGFVFIKKIKITTNDRDGDGVLNDRDKCPDQFGTGPDGCPPVRFGDEDKQQDDDYDGIANNDDACPNEYGTAKARGCPDRDNDGVPNISDECPDKAGEPYAQGCPDTDGDGLYDHEDDCPNQKGTRADKGCPPPDRDGDGVPDKVDQCPDQKGLAYLQGCPETPPTRADDGFVFVKGGTMTIGSPTTEKDRGDDETQHSVKVSDFYMAKYEVTIGQYLLFCDETKSNYPEWLEQGSSYHIETGSIKEYYKEKGMSRENTNYPISGVSWNNAVAYCQWMSKKTGKNYRLPTEAEWEYAARGGQSAKGYLYAGSNNIDEVAWYSSNSDSKTHPVGKKNANELGLYDMTGNVCEWCSDWYGTYPKVLETDYDGPDFGSYRVRRGGSWDDYPQDCRAADRFYDSPDYCLSGFGFRLSRTP